MATTATMLTDDMATTLRTRGFDPRSFVAYRTDARGGDMTGPCFRAVELSADEAGRTVAVMRMGSRSQVRAWESWAPARPAPTPTTPVAPIVDWRACCALARPLHGCVCHVAFTCPTHGERHVGTHD